MSFLLQVPVILEHITFSMGSPSCIPAFCSSKITHNLDLSSIYLVWAMHFLGLHGLLIGKYSISEYGGFSFWNGPLDGFSFARTFKNFNFIFRLVSVSMWCDLDLIGTHISKGFELLKRGLFNNPIMAPSCKLSAPNLKGTPRREDGGEGKTLSQLKYLLLRRNCDLCFTHWWNYLPKVMGL